MTNQQMHPSPKELSAFSLGQLPTEAADLVEHHISECEPCCETLLHLGSEDTFLALLQAANGTAGEVTVLDSPPGQQAGSASEVPPALVGHPRYDVLGLIGRGGMGNVYRATHRIMDRTVALKIINPNLMRKPEAVDRFQREVKAAARLSHPNIVTAHDAEQAGDVHFLVMEFVTGIELAQLVKQQGPLAISQACEFARQAALGLEHAHGLGLVHRDMKPHNLMVTETGIVKILDFGLASLNPEFCPEEPEGTSAELTAAGAIMGTPDFMSPEQASDARQADIRSDIYSLGATLYYLLTGQPPFAEGSMMEKLQSHAEDEPTPLARFRNDVPEELVEILERMMAKNPAERFQTPAEVAEALSRFAQPGANQKSRRLVGRILRAALLVCSLVFLAGVVFYFSVDSGDIEIEVSEPLPVGAKVVLLKEGEEFASFDLKPGRATQRIRAGEYQVVLETDSKEAQMSVWTKRWGSNNWGEPDRHEDQPVVVYRGGGLLIHVKKRQPPTINGRPVGKANPELRQAVEKLTTEAAKATTDAQWKRLLPDASPLVEEYDLAFAKEFIGLFTNLPKHLQESLLKDGYLKWRFNTIDKPRQQQMRRVLVDILNTPEANFPKDALPEVLNLFGESDAGFAVLDVSEPNSQVIVWYLLPPDSPAPIILPILSSKEQSDPDVYTRSVTRQIGELDDKPYSKLPK